MPQNPTTFHLNRPRVRDFCCDSPGNSSRTEMHTQAKQRAYEVEASCGLPTRFDQHSSSKIYGLADYRFFVFGLLLLELPQAIKKGDVSVLCRNLVTQLFGRSFLCACGEQRKPMT